MLESVKWSGWLIEKIVIAGPIHDVMVACIREEEIRKMEATWKEGEQYFSLLFLHNKIIFLTNFL
jgi:hypothetical protein